MDIIIRLSREAARGLESRGPVGRAAEEVLHSAAEYGVSLRPLHPGVGDTRLAAYYRVEVPDRQTADQVIAALTKNKAVEAAFVKPPDRMP